MKNLDTLKEQKTAIFQKINAAMTGGKIDELNQALDEFSDFIQKSVMDEAKGVVESTDRTILAGRGARQLTSAENKYFQEVIDAMKSSNPRQALADIPDVMPKTVIDTVFEDLVAEHPLLSAINFQNTSGLIDYLVNTNGVQCATWGALTAKIVTELTGGFKKIPLTLDKLSAFLPVAKSMLDLGPAYMDRFVRATLGEALYYGLELGIIAGTGKDQPIGMNRQVGTGVVVTDGVYPEKTPNVITSLDPETYSTLLALLTAGPNGKPRKVTRVALIVNPADYVGKIFPATTIRGADGKYINDVFPFPTDVYQSVEVPSGKALFGLPARYFMGIGTAQSGKIEYSDEYHFLEDERVYLVKLYGHGEPLDNNAFLYLDISGLVAPTQEVKVTNLNEGSNDARLSSLTLGALTLSPAFNKSVMNYTAATTAATNTITAVAMDGEATITIKNGATTVANGSAATWAAGANTVTIDVAVGGETEKYTVVVTKS